MQLLTKKKKKKKTASTNATKRRDAAKRGFVVRSAEGARFSYSQRPLPPRADAEAPPTEEAATAK